MNYDAADNPRFVSPLEWLLAFVSIVPCTLSITINNDLLIAGTRHGKEEIRSCRAVPPGGSWGVSPPKISKKGGPGKLELRNVLNIEEIS